MLNQYQDILTAEEVSEILMIGMNRTYELLNNGSIKGFRIGKKWKIPREALIEYILCQSKFTAPHNRNI